ncbi:MAG: arginine--tRNA ligase [Candidatus Bathyarchaeota archaeon]
MGKKSLNLFGSFREECEIALKDVVNGLFPGLEFPKFLLASPASPSYGELSSSICFELAKKFGEKPIPLAEKLTKNISKRKFMLIESVESINGYLNFHVNYSKLMLQTSKAFDTSEEAFGSIKTKAPKKIIVEHTSANPSGPLHVGTARNAILGDALARILTARGHHVRRHFYIDDVGKQVAIATYGYKIVAKPRIEGKPDAWIGFLYTATNCALTIRTLKNKIKALKDEDGSGEELERLQQKLDESLGIAAELELQDKKVLHKIIQGIEADSDPEKSIEELMSLYEQEDLKTKQLVRSVVNSCLRGFRKTLQTAKIKYDVWDWESELIWSGEVKKVINRLNKTPYLTIHEGAKALDVDSTAKKLGIKDKLVSGIPYEIPPLVLVRSDKTTLYTTRDIAYHLRKFSWADKAINVIGVDQKLAQLQLKVALFVLGLTKAIDNLIHYSYELVKLPGYKMSRRSGRYITFDELMTEAVQMAYQEVTKRSPELSEKEKRKISKIVGLGAVKYAMFSVSATKTVTFTWDKVLNFEINSGPFAQYAYVRASSILHKIKFQPSKPDFHLLQHPLERKLVIKLSSYPEVFIMSADNLKPEMLVAYVNEVAEAFNAFYNELPVIKAENVGLRDARIKLVTITQRVLSNSLQLLGIETPQRM